MSSKLIFLVAAIALLAGLFLCRGGWISPGYRGSDATAAVGRAVVTDTGEAASDRLARNHRAMVSHKPDRRADFESARDLYDYVQALAPAMRAKDPDAIWMVTRVYDYCSGYSMAPADYAKDTQVIGDLAMRASTAMVAARNRVSRRCARFMPEDNLSYKTILLKRVEAARAGSLAAEAALLAMGEPLKSGDEYKRDLVQRVQRSRDPESYAALSPAMGIRASGQLTFSDQIAGTQFAELAWQIAACKLGLDCGPDSALMTSYCANGGICSRDKSQGFTSFVYDAAIPRQGAEVVNEMVDSLVSERGL